MAYFLESGVTNAHFDNARHICGLGMSNICFCSYRILPGFFLMRLGQIYAQFYVILGPYLLTIICVFLTVLEIGKGFTLDDIVLLIFCLNHLVGKCQHLGVCSKGKNILSGQNAHHCLEQNAYACVLFTPRFCQVVSLPELSIILALNILNQHRGNAGYYFINSNRIKTGHCICI